MPTQILPQRLHSCSRFLPVLRLAFTIVAVAILVVTPARCGAEELPAIDFGRDIRPILSDKCFRCHGPDAGERQTELRLDIRESALSHAIVAGDSGTSDLVDRITSGDESFRMPPPETGKQLTAAEVETLRRWIDEGAVWSEHWAFIAPRRPAFPVAPAAHAAWVQNEIDLFTLPRMLGAGLVPATQAKRAALLRRVTFDLTGLPPTPRELTAFLNDHRPGAFERVVDRLLNSPRYGEHQARYWLDVARYGDTHGLHLDNERSIWPYRDWVVQAFNQNLPFDQFTVEQLAGDLLPNPSREQRIATGFHRCNVTTGEGGSIDAEYLARYASDRVETTATTWLGLTAGCAACHDHKFDPISQREFYQLYAYFYSLSEKAMDGNALLPPPSISAPTMAQIAKRARLARKLEQTEAELIDVANATADKLPRWEAEFRDSHVTPLPPADTLIHCTLDEHDGRSVPFRHSDQSATGHVRGTVGWEAAKINGGFRFDGKTEIDLGENGAFDRDQAFTIAAWVYVSGEGGADTVVSKMDDANGNRGYDVYIGDNKLFVHLIHRWSDDAIRINTTQPLYKQKWQHICVTYDGSSKAAGVTVYLNGAEQEVQVTHDTLTGSLLTDQPLRFGKRSTSAPLNGMLDEVRIYRRVLLAEERGALLGADPIGVIVHKPKTERSDTEQQTLTEFLLQRNQDGYNGLLGQRHDLSAAIRRHEGQYPSTLVMQEMSSPRQAHVLIRGQYDQPGDTVAPGVPSSLPPMPAGAPTNRLGLARWLVDPAHPLTARVTVNRIWQRYFGIGIVATTEDFGSQGEWPSHPMLLDWLAVELIDSGWDLKSLHRKIVCSATYRQSASVSPKQLELDPMNRWLSRGPRFRMDAEMIRDNALAISGLLIEQHGGRAVKPYQPLGLWKAVGYTSSNTARFKRDDGAALYRRSLYTFWKRTSPPPAMQILDAPSREVCTAKRPRTNTPAAALLLMNDVQFVEASQSLAYHVLIDPQLTTLEQRIDKLYLLATTRRPNSREAQVLAELWQAIRGDFDRDARNGEADPARQFLAQGETKPLLNEHDDRLAKTSIAARAAWTMLASTVLNLDETVNK